jgi:hypothetical protein
MRPVRSTTDHNPLTVPFSLEGGQPGIRARRIFILKRVSRLPAASPRDETVQRILIFDDHPESLRLVFGRRVSPPFGRSAPANAGWWEPVLGWMLMMGVLSLMFLLLCLKLPS